MPWDTVLARPAVRNMTASQLRAAIALGGDIVAGRVDLRRLDEASLKGRGKWAGKYGGGDGGDAEKGKGKRKREREAEHEGSAKVVVMKKKTKKQAVLQFDNMMGASERKQTPSAPKRDVGKDLATLKRIRADLSLTSFRRRLYTSLLSVPCGRYTTYAALAKHLHSIPRAVGNGMRNNPFAPDVPCHRVLASDGTIGGFGGDWSRDKGLGMTEKQKEKMSLLRAEGVKFDGMGKVMGAVWEGFWDEEGFERNFDEVTSRVE